MVAALTMTERRFATFLSNPITDNLIKAYPARITSCDISGGLAVDDNGLESIKGIHIRPWGWGVCGCGNAHGEAIDGAVEESSSYGGSH